MANDVVKSNALVKASYRPASLWQMRLLIACLVQIKAKEKLSHRQTFSVYATALAELTGSAAKTSYRKLSRAADELMDMHIRVDFKPDGELRKRHLRKINVVSQCDYVEKEGRVALQFTHSIIPYISDLSERFTKIKAEYLMPMRSVYGHRLYELCLMYLGPSREFEVDEFRDIMGLGDKYPRVEMLRHKVIIPAMADVNKYTDIRLEYGQRKAGRRVSHFQFKITRLDAPGGKVIHSDQLDLLPDEQSSKPRQKRKPRRPSMRGRPLADDLNDRSWSEAEGQTE